MPMQACSFEAMLAGQQHLYDLGYLLEDSENDDREDAQQVTISRLKNAPTPFPTARPRPPTLVPDPPTLIPSSDAFPY